MLHNAIESASHWRISKMLTGRTDPSAAGNARCETAKQARRETVAHMGMRPRQSTPKA